MQGETAYSSAESEISDTKQRDLPLDVAVEGVENPRSSHDPLLDKEWLILISMAKGLGISREEIRVFLQTADRKNPQTGEKAV